MTIKVAINKSNFMFDLSPKAISEIAKLKGHQSYFYVWKYKGSSYVRVDDFNSIDRYFSCLIVFSRDLGERFESLKDVPMKYLLDYNDLPRDDKDLVQVIEELGEEANWGMSELKIDEIPGDIE